MHRCHLRHGNIHRCVGSGTLLETSPLLCFTSLEGLKNTHSLALTLRAQMLNLSKCMYLWRKNCEAFHTDRTACIHRTSEPSGLIKLFFYFLKCIFRENQPSLRGICVSRSSPSLRSPQVVDTLKLELIDFRMPCHQCPYAAVNYIWSILVIKL